MGGLLVLLVNLRVHLLEFGAGPGQLTDKALKSSKNGRIGMLNDFDTGPGEKAKLS